MKSAVRFHRRALAYSAGAALVALTLAAKVSAQELAAPSEWTPALMMKVKQVGSVQPSPNGKQVAIAVRQAVLDGDKSEYLTHIHVANADGSDSTQLTHGDKSCDDPQWSPDGKWIAYVSSRSGKKNLWVTAPSKGEPQQLTDVRTGVISFRWSPDGQSLAFTAKEPQTLDEIKSTRSKDDARVVDENIKMNRLYVIPFPIPPKLQLDARALTPSAFSVGGGLARPAHAAFDWSPDGRTIVFSHTRTPGPNDWPSADLSIVDVPSGTIKSLVATAAAESSPRFAPDGKWIAFVSSDNPPTWAGKAKVHIVSQTGESPRALADTADSFGRYSELVGWSADGQSLYCTEVDGTNLRLVNLPLQGSPAPNSIAAGMSLSGVSLNASRTTFGFGWETLTQAPEAFISAADRVQPVQASRINQDLPKAAISKTDVIRWKSTDGFDVEGLLTFPVGYADGKRHPLLVIVHGGPMGVFTQSFIGAPNPYPVATFAARGYAVLRPNVRGSSGYGAKFRYANYGDWGGGDYRDLMSGVDHVIKLGVADPERLGIMGWSYGGFMTSWTITQSKRFKAASVGAGVTNLMSFTGTADIPSFLPDYFGGEFWDSSKLNAYQAHSAMFQVKGVATPTLIQHGERDERVPLSQGLELYNALKRQGCTTKMIIYPRTPHGIEEPRLLMDCMQRNLEWFDRYLRK